MKSRKTNSSSTTITQKPKTTTFGSASITAAAVSVTKFGQATFTSVRRQDHENGNFVPLKKSKLDEEQTHTSTSSTIAKPIENKPKVYKFFKSRISSDNNRSNTTAHRSPPRPLVLNNFSKQDGIKRITTTPTTQQSTYSRNKNNDRNYSTQHSSSTLISKSVNIEVNKSCEIKICGDKTIKKIISPNKITEFIIKNNSSNVRNATIKPISTATPVQILPSSRGIRSSRRLKGIEPDTSIESTSPRTSSAIHVVFEKKSNDETLTTTIDISNDGNDEDDPQNCTILPGQRDETNKTDQIENLNGNDSDSDAIKFDKLFKTKNEQTSAENQIINNNNNNNNNSNVDNNETNLMEEPMPMETAQEETDQSSQQSSTMDEKESVQTNPTNGSNDENKNNQNVKTGEQQPQENKIENKTYGAKPKKKIFSNRDRNKVEFNTKSFFSSDLKDEFEMELDKNQATSNVEKKPIENDEDETYIKLKRIKKAHQCHEQGETEQFDEDIKYYLSGIVSSNPNSMRCLSILGLTQQAMRPEFRMHLRAHDDMPRIIKALMDAPQDSNLALCTGCLMFIYNQDRLTMDIDPNALSLMLELLETRSDECNLVEEKHRSKVRSMVEEMKNKGHAQYLKLDEITAGKLAMETLLGLTSKRAGDWFKVELRKKKGIDFIVNTVIRCAEDYSKEGQMVKIDRCMHVLENVTFNNVENQLFITNYNDSKFISVCINLLIKCKHEIISSNDSKIFLSAFFSILRVLTNLTSESMEGCKIVGTFDGVIELLLESLFELPSFIMSDQRFDLMVIILCLCINLAEFCEHIRDIIINSNKFMSKLSELLFKKIEEAAQVEQQTDHLLESHETVQMTEAMQDNLLMQMISKSGTHMEHSLLSACVCLLFGCCIQDSDQYKDSLKSTLPNNSFKPLIEQLEKLRDFAHLADIMTQKGKDRVQKVLQMFKASYNSGI